LVGHWVHERVPQRVLWKEPGSEKWTELVMARQVAPVMAYRTESNLAGHLVTRLDRGLECDLAIRWDRDLDFGWV